MLYSGTLTACVQRKWHKKMKINVAMAFYKGKQMNDLTHFEYAICSFCVLNVLFISCSAQFV